MKALQITGYGNNDVTVISKDAPVPGLKEGSVLVKVYHAALNPVDWKMRGGSQKKMLSLSFPATLGCDFCGVVVEKDKNVTAFKIGDEVFGSAIPSLGGSGAFAEYVVTPSKNVALMPKNTSPAIAAASVTVSVCAYLCLQVGNLGTGSKVLIIGGAGGIGRAAIQLAKSMGAYVATMVHTKDMDVVRKIGADEVIDSSRNEAPDLLKDYDLVVDTVGGKEYKLAYSVLRKGAIMTSVTEQPDKGLMEKYGVDAKFILGFPFTERLEAVKGFIEKKILSPYISKTFTLDEAREALEYQEHGKPGGKVVLNISKSA
ncbi:NADP-dependent oxidoreductase [Flagellimonas lutimaris]|uniref:NADP-dependent oxidoreductase n=1 Tax=Flagellimonas lutimaris TaxID=475082 RepID=UPI003F5CDD03